MKEKPFELVFRVSLVTLKNPYSEKQVVEKDQNFGVSNKRKETWVTFFEKSSNK